ncbi:UDP-N-acetylmuramate--L-alanine ligase [Luteibaculum oceani]|uniref:UDP-N-acetylmuramate--L-alanine ligase n=1 Tax=Luteibaculum oceani TaxID=1294296 RepID=A0A5C6UZL0_9FLAO|nr:UDP-N-acetylmuramate--L-alanine ligase [Luteibaculum oceani]TXC78873.1 UDP-N-acetylmuramate--L-alanine ligase [Luteibaculum oceani]
MHKDGQTYKNLYFLGIGGIGMSALAQYYAAKGLQVAGYDRFESDTTDLLKSKGIPVTFTDSEDALPGSWLIDETAVIYTPAVPKDLKRLAQFRSLGLPIFKRSEVLGWLSKEIPTVAIAGTHGKTTTTSITAHIFKSAGYRVLAFIGGISANYGSNIIMDDNPEVLIVEADEFDRSFLHLSPKWAVITSVDPDHLDIYSNSDAFYDAFHQFANSVSDELLLHQQVGEELKKKDAKHYPSDVYAIQSRAIVEGKVEVKLKIQNNQIQFTWLMPGKYNTENALAACSMAVMYGITNQKISTAMETYAGVKRRFEAIYQGVNGVLIDDYAHHPNELAALGSALKELYPGKKITLVFQPHLYSRTRDFLNEFAEQLSAFTKVLLLPIYPAREEPIPGVCSEALLEKINCEDKACIAPFDLLHYAAKFDGDVLVLAGAGDISKMVDPVKKIMEGTQE